MSSVEPSRITTLLEDLRRGSESAKEELISLVYPELRRIAARYIRQERPDRTLRITSLVNEVYTRVFGTMRVDWQSRAHLFAAVAREMRHTLVDYARARDPQKRPDPGLKISLNDLDVTGVAIAPDDDIVSLDDVLSRLEAVDPRASQVVELRYFTGLSEREAAEALGVSLFTLKRDWNFAKAWFISTASAG